MNILKIEEKKVNIKKEHDIIYKDIINNIEDVTLRQNYFSKKYRSDIDCDRFVGFINEGSITIIKIYLRNKNKAIRTVIVTKENQVKTQETKVFKDEESTGDFRECQ